VSGPNQLLNTPCAGASVPKGRPNRALVFSRPLGTGFFCRLIPALKRRAIFGCPSGTECRGHGNRGLEVHGYPQASLRGGLGFGHSCFEPIFRQSWRRRSGIGVFAAGSILILAPNSLLACAACYGQSDSPLAQGMNWGIASLLGTILLVLGGIAGFFVSLARRSAALSRAGTADAATSVSQHQCGAGILPASPKAGRVRPRQSRNPLHRISAPCAVPSPDTRPSTLGA